MHLRLGLAALAVTLVSTMPSYALFCASTGGSVVQFGFSVGEAFTEAEINNFDLMTLRQQGVDATAVERWNGCIRAYVRKPEGGEEMQFFDPDTYQRVQ